jgi:succinyl-diaminopimelate desuccinylase
MTRRDGRLYGIGMGNMKAGVAALSLAYAFLAQHSDLWSGTVSLAAVADETVFGPDGAAWLLETKPELLGDALICGEGPGSMELSIAEKGVLWITLEARAAAGQGMLSRRGSSAIARLCNAIAEIDAWNDERVAAPVELSCLEPRTGDHGLRISVNTGTIKGGKFISQTASHAVAEIDIRVPPGLTTSDIESRLRKLVDSVSYLVVRRIKSWDPNWTAPQSYIVACVSSAAKLVRGNAPRPVVRLPASDASRWRSRGVPAVCYGPQPMLASGIDDFAFEQDVIDCAKVYATAALSYLAGP